MDARLELQDIIDEHLTKTHAILNCLLAAWSSDHHVDQDTIFHALWSMEDHLLEIKKYRDASSKRGRQH
ncbi:MAG: hypothetical protein PVI75_01860 [Gammaproteobacteria bacterium]|jgi:hypothetical protein